MSENKKYFESTVGALFSGLSDFMSTKTVVGDPITINDTIIVPLVEVNFGIGATSGEKPQKNSAGGGMGAKMKPTAVLVINKGNIRMVPVEQPTTTIAKIIDLVPEIINKFTSKDEEVEAKIQEIIEKDVEK